MDRWLEYFEVTPEQAHAIRARGERRTGMSEYLWARAKQTALKNLTTAQRFAIARAQAEQTLTRLKAAGWDESEHPRDPDGKFTDGGGDGGTGSSKPSGGKGKGKAKKEDFEKAKIRLNVGGGPEGEQKFIEKWNEKVGVEPEEFKKQFVGGVDSTMTISGSGGEFEVAGHIQDNNGHAIGEYQRRINLDRKTAYSAYFKLKGSSTKHNIGKKLLAGNVEMYEKLGVEEVGVTANIDVGGYAWAKYGYVPTQAAWDSMRGSLERKLVGGVSRPSSGSGRTNTEEAEEWSWIPDDQQTEVRDRWMRDTRSDFYDSEVQNWQDSGGALDQAKSDLAGNFVSAPEWAVEALDQLREERETAGDPPIPYTNAQLFSAIHLDYETNGEGTNDPDVSFDNAYLRDPKGSDPNQQTLPGIEPPDLSEKLTEEMRNEIEAEIVRAFNSRADLDQNHMDAPDHIGEQVEEYQQQYWDEMEDSQRLEFAQRYGLANVDFPIDEDEEEEEAEEELELEPAPATDPVLEAVRSRDPKSIWKVADSPQGKALLLGTSWSGKLFLKDADALKRFKAYVGKAA